MYINYNSKNILLKLRFKEYEKMQKIVRFKAVENWDLLCVFDSSRQNLKWRSWRS